MFVMIAVAAVQAAAGSVAPSPTTVDTVPAVEQVQPQSMTLPALTPLRLKIDKDLISKTAVIGEEFDIVLATPIDLGNGFAVPAGTRGRGWVIHASKARMGGKAGELLLGARYLKIGNVEIPLRSMKLGPPQGKDNTGLSMGLMATVGIAGAFVSGGQVRVESGMDAIAKTAADVVIPMALLEKAVMTGPAIVATPVAPLPASAPANAPEKSVPNNVTEGN